jgi:CrcB protein
MHHLPVILLVGLAGAAGTLLRMGLTTLAVRLCGGDFPWGTFLVNLLGSFAFGLIFGLVRSRGLTPAQEVILLVGLLGGFTTYSSFAFQSLELLSTGRMAAGLAYILFTNSIGIAAVWAGLRLTG